MPEQISGRLADLEVLHEPSPVRVVLGALSPVYAHGLRAVLQSSGFDCSVVADLAQVSLLLAAPQPLVAVVAESGMAAVLPVAPAAARHAVVVLVEQATAETCAAVLRAGVTGLITAADAPEHVVDVLHGAARGNTVLPRAVVQALCRPASLSPPSLSPVEQTWLRRLASGGTVAGLARACGYSEREMYRRLSGLYLRLGATTRTEALLAAERFGLLEHPS